MPLDTPEKWIGLVLLTFAVVSNSYSYLIMVF